MVNLGGLWPFCLTNKIKILHPVTGPGDHTAIIFPALLFCLIVRAGPALCEGSADRATSADFLRVAAIQPNIEECDYSSAESFEAGIYSMAARAQALAGDPGVDLLVFPEYVGVFLAATPYSGIITVSETFEEAMDEITGLPPGGRKRKIDSLRALFISESSRVAQEMDRIFGTIAKEYDAVVVGGSYFHWDGGAGTLTNRAVVYGSSGERLYEQDKVFLTEFEQYVVELDPGSFKEVTPFQVKGYEIALTICRDTYYRRWESLFTDTFLWVDIKANGQEYTQEQAFSFSHALPARIAGTGVPYGLTTCLTGSFLDLHWEGPTSLIRYDEARGYLPVKAIPSPRKEGVLFVAMEP